MSATAERLPSGRVTFLFTDVEGSTRLFRQLGDSFVPLLEAHNSILRREIEASGGTVVKTEGDGTFAAFTSAAGALAACRRAQRALAEHPWPAGAEIRVRMGVHTGTASPSGGDYVALPVNQAARVADAAQGGQVLVTTATRADLPDDAPLRDLGSFRLRDFDEPEGLFDLVEGEPCPPPRALPAAAHNFPRSRSSFVGREAELDELRELLPQTPLLTLVGTGGMGKTRLAREAAITVLEAFPDGAWLVELASLSGSEQVLPAIANALAIREIPGEALEDAVVDRLRDASLLLALDNCEHLLDRIAEIVDAILDSAPAVRILATSQERLGVAGELIWPVAPLALPPSDADAANGSASGAVQLFVERAASARPGFRLDETNAAAVVDVCRHLDGLPLAIELAAARVSALSPMQISERLDRRFDLLSGGERGAISRHRTLRAAIEWSCELLPELERVAVRRIAVFAGSFSLEAAEAVVRGEDIAVSAVAGMIEGLVEHSLLEVRDDDRYLALETVREYGRILLAEAGEEAAARDRHLEWIAEALAQQEGESAESWYERIDAEYGELREAMTWSLDGGDPALGLRALARTGSFLADRARTAEGRAWIEDLLDRAESAGPEDRASGLAISSRLAFVSGDFATARRAGEEGLALAEELSDTVRASHFLRLLGNVALYEERVAQARELYLKAVEEGPEISRIRAQLNLGLAELMLGNLEGAEAQAADVLERTAREHRGEQPYARSLLAMVAVERGDGPRAAEFIARVIEDFRPTSNLYELAEAVEMAGAACLFCGDADGAAWLLGASDGVYEAAGAVRPEGFFTSRYEAWAERAEDSLGEGRFAQLADAGRGADPVAAVGTAAEKMASLLAR